MFSQEITDILEPLFNIFSQLLNPVVSILPITNSCPSVSGYASITPSHFPLSNCNLLTSILTLI